MRTELPTQLREYAGYLEETGRRIEVERIEQIAGTQLVRSPRRLRGWVIAAGAAVATVVLIGGLGVFRDDSRQDVGGDPTPSPVLDPVPTTSPVSDAAPPTVEEDPAFDPTTIPIEEIPPFHAIIQTWYYEGRGRVPPVAPDEVTAMMIYEIWYDGESGWRSTSLELEGDREFMPAGSYDVWTGNEYGFYNALTNTWRSGEEYVNPLSSLMVDDDIFYQNCEEAGTTTLIGRTVHRYVCVDEDMWIDESGLVLARSGGPSPLTHEVLELDLNPDFPEDIFVFDPPDDAEEEGSRPGAGPPDGFDHPTVGQPAPPLVGELANGDDFDLRDSLGTPVVIVFWYSLCPPCLEHLDTIHQVAARHADITFVTALVVDSLSDAQTAIDQQGYTLPVLDTPASDPYEEAGIAMGVPTTVLINPDGTIAAVFYGKITDPDDWEDYFYEGAGW